MPEGAAHSETSQHKGRLCFVLIAAEVELPHCVHPSHFLLCPPPLKLQTFHCNHFSVFLQQLVVNAQGDRDQQAILLIFYKNLPAEWRPKTGPDEVPMKGIGQGHPDSSVRGYRKRTWRPY